MPSHDRRCCATLSTAEAALIVGIGQAEQRLGVSCRVQRDVVGGERLVAFGNFPGDVRQQGGFVLFRARVQVAFRDVPRDQVRRVGLDQEAADRDLTDDVLQGLAASRAFIADPAGDADGEPVRQVPLQVRSVVVGVAVDDAAPRSLAERAAEVVVRVATCLNNEDGEAETTMPT